MSEELKRFKPERPIYLNEANTGFKSKAEVLFAIEQLRNLHKENPDKQPWLVAYSENAKPFHMSFNNEAEFQKFKKDCKDLKITLKSPIIHPDDEEEMLANERADSVIGVSKMDTANESYEDTSGKQHIVR